MKINIDAAQSAMSFASKIASSSIVAAYGSVMVQAKDGTATFTCTNGQTTLSASVECDSDISVCVDAKRLATFCKNAKNDLKFTLKDSKLNVSSGRSRTSLVASQVSQFPDLPVVSGEPFVVGSKTLKSCIESVVYAAGKTDQRPAANGIYLGNGHVVATRGVVLAACPLDVKLDSIIPIACVPSLLSMMDDDCHITVDDSVAIFRCGSFELVTKLVSAKYFSWDKFIPDTDKSFQVSKSDLLKSLSMVQMTVNKIMRVMLSVNGNLLTVSSSDSVNETVDEIDLESSTGDIEIMFSINLLVDTCNALAGDLITLKYTDSGKAAMLSGDSDNIHIIMPQK